MAEKVDPGLVAGGVFTGLVTASLLALHLARPVCPRVGRWNNRPDVFVYRHCPVRVGHVAEAIAKLRPTGLSFGQVQETDSSSMRPGCIVIGPMDAETARANAIASASWATEHPEEKALEPGRDSAFLVTAAQQILGPIEEGQIAHAYIGVDALMLEGRDPVRVIAHELVHAQGFLHTETALLGRRKRDGKRRPEGSARWGVVGRQSGHLMHPEYGRGGWKLRGIEA